MGLNIKNNNFWLVIIIFIGCLLIIQEGVAYQLPLSGEALVSYVQGEVKVNQKVLGHGEKIKAPVQVIVGPQARLELRLPEGSILRFDSKTHFNLVKVQVDGEKREMKTEVSLGRCWAWVKKIMGRDSSFEVNSPTAVAGVAGTVYRLDVEQNKASSYYVYQGKIKVGYNPYPDHGTDPHSKIPHRVSGPQRIEGPKRISIKQWNEIVSKGYFLQIGVNGLLKNLSRFDMQTDQQNPWVKWNLDRDKITALN